MGKKIRCYDRDGKEYEVDESELTFRPSVYGIVIKDGKILLAKQWDGYDFPGGGVEIGETVREALKREVKEETGMEVKVGEILLCEDTFFKLPFRGNFVHSILMYYICEVEGGELSMANFDEDEKKYGGMPEWVDLDQAKNVKIYSSINAKKIFEKIKTGR